jgi:hypothetical protein
MVARYSGGGGPWGTIVPMIEMTAREMSRDMVSFKEQKKSHRECRKSRLLVVTCETPLFRAEKNPFST